MAKNPSANDPLVSVVVPVHNQREYVAETFNCLVGQTYGNVEVVLVDDGSTDGSGEMLDGLAGAGVRVIHQPNRGRSAARNAGMRSARGEFVQFLDGDDLLSPDKLTHDTAYLSAHPETDLVTCEACYFRNSLRHSRSADAVKPFDDWQAALLGGCRLPIHGPLFRRRVLERVSRFDEELSFGEDWEYWLRCAAAGTRAEFVPGVRAFYRLRRRQNSEDSDSLLGDAVAVLGRARQSVEEHRGEPFYAYPLLGSHAEWAQRARAAGRESVWAELREEVRDWPALLPPGLVHSEYGPAGGVELWTNVLLAFGDDAAMRRRAGEEWDRARRRVEASPDGAGVRALLKAQQGFLRYEDGSCRELAVAAGETASRVSKFANATRTHPCPLQNMYYVPGEEGIWIYGGGAHTHWLLSEFDVESISLAGIVDDDARLWGSHILGLAVMSPQSAAEAGCNVVLISSDEHEERLAERAGRVFPRAQVYRLYATSSGRCEPVSGHCPS